MSSPPSCACRADAIPTTQALSDGRAASSIYGAEHLLRLFVKLPELMAVAVATEQQAANVAAMVQVGLTAVYVGFFVSSQPREGGDLDVQLVTEVADTCWLADMH